MKKLVPLVCLLALGCGDDDRPMDSGVSLMDSGIRPRSDGGGGTDAGSGTDAGGGTDAGSAGMCADPLPDLIELNARPGTGMGMLLPRCSADTQTAISMCRDVACLNAALAADMTPGLDIGGGTILDCELCYNAQVNKCIDDACPMEFADLRCCLESNGCTSPSSCPACMAQLDTLRACADTSVGPGDCDALTNGCFP